MHPELFGVVKSFGLMLAISFALGMWLSVRRARPYGIRSETVLDLVFIVLVSSLVGVRLFYVLTHLGSFDPWYRVFAIWDGGLTLYGGILLAIVAVWWQARRRGVPFLVIADIFAPGVMLGIGITRIGCFLAGCCYGQPCAGGACLHFPPGSPAWIRFGEVGVQPSQLYSSAGGFAVFALLLLLERWRPVRGATFGRFLVLYGIMRFLVDFTRYYEPEQIVALGWTNNQWISVAMVAAGAAVLWRACRRPAGKGGA
ncbi:MAG: prolipoprotein diacylglyceryl transferase [Candidatus Krumholzibacteriia bacterium]